MKQAIFYYQDPNAPEPNQPDREGVSVFICWQDQVLLEYRADSDVWCFISGGMEPEETALQGACREVEEETGICITPQQLAFLGRWDDPSRIIHYPDGNIVRIITNLFSVQLTEEPVLRCSRESRQLQFFGAEELRGLPLAKTHIPMREVYLNKMG